MKINCVGSAVFRVRRSLDMPDPVCVLAAQFFLMGSTASEQLQMLDVIICLSSLAVGESIPSSPPLNG